MNIETIGSFCTEFVGFVRVTAEDGTQGWGQVATYNADIADGEATVTDAPGWGVEISPDWMARSRYRQHRPVRD